MVFISHPQAKDDLPVVPVWINGSAHPTSDEDTLFPVISSVQDKTIHHAVSATPAMATLAVESAAAAFAKWGKTAPSHRRKLLLQAADAVDRKAEEIAASQIAETSCPEPFAKFNIMSTTWMREIAAATSQIRGTVAQTMEGEDGLEGAGLTIVVKEAIGVVLIIPP